MHLEILEEIPNPSLSKMKNLWDQQVVVKQQRITDTKLPLQKPFDLNDEVWVINKDKHKLQPEKVGPFLVVIINKGYNTYAVKYLVPPFQIKNFHHKHLRTVRA